MKNKILLVMAVFVIVFIVIGFVYNQSSNDTFNEEPKHVKEEDLLSMMLETGIETGEYNMVAQSSWPSKGYKFNSALSKCENGSELSWDDENKSILFSGNKTDKCYIYFDKDYVKLSLNDYTFSWPAVDDASSYQIYSDGELLTTTTDTTAEIYSFYESAGTYSITVKALDDNNNNLVESKSLSYTLEKTEYPVSAYISEFNVDINADSRWELGEECTFSTMSTEAIDATKYSINYINLFTYMSTNNISYDYFSGFLRINGRIDLNINYCKTSNLCVYSKLNELDTSVTGSDLLFKYNATTSKIEVQPSWAGQYVYLALQFIEVGKVSSDWKLFGAQFTCLSSNTDIYVYDRKKKKFKKKRIGDLDYDDEVLCWDFDKGEFTIAKPIWLQKRQLANKYNLLKFSDGSILETIDQHRIYNVEKGMFTYPMTDDTPIGTTTFNSNGEYVKLVSKEVIEEPIDYYNLNIEEHINVFANGILTSCRLNNMYPIENMKFVYDKKKDNGYDLSDIDERLVKGLRLKEQDMTEEEIKKYVKDRELIRKM